MQIFVKTLAGNTVAVEAEAHTTVAAVAAQVESQEVRLLHAGKQLDEDCTLAEYGIQQESTVEAVLSLCGGKGGKKKKKRIFKGPKKVSHRHKNVPMRVLKFYKVEGDGEDEEFKVTHERMECPHPDCGAGVFMAVHKDRQTCGKCSLTYVFQKK